jgi:tRNA(Ile)-lysidine synthase
LSTPASAPLFDGFVALALGDVPTVAVAISGGGDSTALLSLLLTKFPPDQQRPRVLALTVDHRLRPESAEEAERVGALCRRLGVEHRVLVWEGQKPSRGVAEAARLARYRLLAKAARDAGAHIVLTGHTADDQAETFAMRSQRGEGPGLAGMAPATLFNSSVWFVRPLIDARRADLRAYLRARGESWIDDPSNGNPAYERARIRETLAEGGAEDMIAAALTAAAAREAVSARVAALLDRHASTVSPGLLRLDQALFDESDGAAEALRLAAACVGGVARLPDLRRTSVLAARLTARERLRSSFAGCVIDASQKGVFLHREWRGGGLAPVVAGAGAVFDGRHLVVSADGGCQLEAAGTSAAKGAGRLVDAAARAEPVVAGPSGAKAELTRIVSPYAMFLPSFDLAAANAAARMLGARQFPAPPWRRHIEGEAA